MHAPRTHQITAASQGPSPPLVAGATLAGTPFSPSHAMPGLLLSPLPPFLPLFWCKEAVAHSPTPPPSVAQETVETEPRSSFALVVLSCVQVRISFPHLLVMPMRAVSGRSRPMRAEFPTRTHRRRSSEEAHSLLG
jgi:hypothetical protein